MKNICGNNGPPTPRLSMAMAGGPGLGDLVDYLRMMADVRAPPSSDNEGRGEICSVSRTDRDANALRRENSRPRRKETDERSANEAVGFFSEARNGPLPRTAFGDLRAPVSTSPPTDLLNQSHQTRLRGRTTTNTTTRRPTGAVR